MTILSLGGSLRLPSSNLFSLPSITNTSDSPPLLKQCDPRPSSSWPPRCWQASPPPSRSPDPLRRRCRASFVVRLRHGGNRQALRSQANDLQRSSGSNNHQLQRRAVCAVSTDCSLVVPGHSVRACQNNLCTFSESSSRCSEGRDQLIMVPVQRARRATSRSTLAACWRAMSPPALLLLQEQSRPATPITRVDSVHPPSLLRPPFR